MNEEWKDISTIEGLEEYKDYQVSNLGRIKSLKKGKEIIRKNGVDKYGYFNISLYANGKHKTFLIHRIVALAFIENTDENKCEVNHIDENKQNNCVWNLEWVTTSQNINYGTRNKRVANVLGKKVFCVELNRIFPSATEVERELSLPQSNISSCCNGKNKTCGGFHWYFINIIEL